MYNRDLTKSRSSRESATTSNANTAYNSREGSYAFDEVQDVTASKLSAVESAAIAAEKALGLKSRELKTTETSEDVVAKLRMDSAIREVESSSFEQKAFVSCRSQQKSEEGSKLQNEEQFQFGTSAEKAAVAINNAMSDKHISNPISVAGDGLCHPNLFGDSVEREERWIDYLYNLRQSIHAENKSVSATKADS